jgi:putative ABC transport system permease protein
MSRLGRFISSFTGGRLQQDVHDEVEFHIEMKTRELVAAGTSLADARAQARRQFGNVAAIEQHTRDIDRLPSLDALGRDLRYSLRALRKSPTFTAVAVATIALGIAANVAVFGMVDALLFRPLPYPDSKRLVLLGTRTNHGPLDWASATDWVDWRAQSATLERLSAYNAQSVNLTGDREPERVIGGFVSADFFSLLGATPIRGRLFQTGDDQPGAAPIVVASYRLWQTRYGGAPDFLGRKLILNGQPYTVAGVLPKEFYFPWSDIDVWMSYLNYPNFRPNARGDLNTGVFGHVKAGHSIEEAQAEMTAIAARLAAQFPDTNRDREASVFNFHDFLARDFRSSLLLLWSAVGLVFLIACANLANLALSRALSREQEMRVRLALGAGRWQLLSQAAVENLLLAAAGLVIALPLGSAALLSLQHGMETVFPLGTVLDLDLRSAAYGGCLALFAALLCSAFAAGQIWKRRTSTTPDAARGATERRGQGLTRRALVVAELALSIVLLSGAGLLLKSYARLSSVDPGFRGAHVLSAEYRVPRRLRSSNGRSTGRWFKSSGRFRECDPHPPSSRCPLAATGPSRPSFFPTARRRRPGLSPARSSTGLRRELWRHSAFLSNRDGRSMSATTRERRGSPSSAKASRSSSGRGRIQSAVASRSRTARPRRTRLSALSATSGSGSSTSRRTRSCMCRSPSRRIFSARRSSKR